MAEVSTFRGTLIFFDRLGIYDVILPFLLVFTIMYAILEKTMVLGTESIEGQKTSRKNLNAMVAFTVSFLTIASSQIVAVINKTASHVVILLLVSVFFMILVGSFWKEEDHPVFLEKPWFTIFMVIMFIGVMIIFLNAITYNGESWLMILLGYIANFNNSEFVSSIILILVVLGFMWFVTKSPKPAAKNQ